ncbi:hypothetical protein BD779DRAFT_362297 [Infundibulicybe gibba]|nr:hypothetical protein BD779DRAFT_362297 [Infundibulicybe gibba]
MSLCTHCATPAKYTCPRCHVRTCSLTCTKAHKAHTGCSGKRDRAAYVPMREYGWGAMMRDYVFLEDVGRRVGDWGREIGRGGYGHGRGVARGNTTSKRDGLKMELDMLDINLDLLPMGMERRKMNQSTWDHKTQTALLTLSITFHPPKDVFVHTPEPHTILTHRNNARTPLIDLLRAVKHSGMPTWALALVHPGTDGADPTQFALPTCTMHAPMRRYYSLSAAKPLFTALQHTSFVEFPEIAIWSVGDFSGTFVCPSGELARTGDGEVPRKRRRLGKGALGGLVGGYGSDVEEKAVGPLGLGLDEYGASDDEDAEGDTDDEVDPALLLRLLQEARDDSEVVDWGEDDEVTSPVA